MKQVITSLGLIAALVLATACSKPSEVDCRKALDNMQVLMGTSEVSKNADLQGEVRRCRGGSSKKAVECAIAAKSLEDLRACDFMHVPEKK
ncbi:hypothetical protein BH11MYX3_BH11MYX3_36580 [soil metagenome]